MRKGLILFALILFIAFTFTGCENNNINDVVDETYDVTMVEVSGTNTINIPEDGVDAVKIAYTAKIKDQYGNEMIDEIVSWSVVNVDGNDVNNFVSIDTDGVITVSNEATAKQDSFKVVATSETNTDIKGQMIVSLESIQSGDPVNLGTAGNYVILSHAGITNDPISDITGDIGVSPIDSTAITGFSLTMDSSNEFATSDQITGKVYAADYSSPTSVNLTTAVSDKGTAYTDAAGRAADYTELYSGDISGKTLEPGVYKWGTGVSINGDVSLCGTATDVWIFQISGQLTQAANTNVILTGNAQAENVFWQVSETVSLETGAHFEGIILGWNDITLGTGVSVNGRLFALNENVTLLQNTITEPQ